MPSAPRRARARTHRAFVVAIDGPAGAGKSTVARGVARQLGFAHLDTGAMYRAITAKALHEGIEPADGRGLTSLARRTAIEFTPRGLRVDGRPVGREIRTQRVNRSVSAVSAHPGVRKELVRIQRAALSSGPLVAEGRDTGTVVFPAAPLKVFLTASIAERARRRHKELAQSKVAVTLSTLRREIARRDSLDSTRTVSPLLPAKDAVVLDTTKKTPRQVIAEIARLARARGADTRRKRAT
jgi:cytidylate kinase